MKFSRVKDVPGPSDVAPLAAPAALLYGMVSTGFFSYLSAVIHCPGRLAAHYWAGPQRRFLAPGLILLLGVGVATLALGLLQAYHPACALIRQKAPLSSAQLTALGHRTQYWGLYTNLRQLALLPLYALPTWLVYRRQGVGYLDAVFVHVLWNTAYTVYSFALFALMTAYFVPVNATPSGFIVLLMLGYLLVIGHAALDLQWPVAVAKALLTVVLVVGLLRLLTCVGF